MLIDELNTSDFFSDDTRADGLSSPPRPSSDSLEQAEGELPAFSPTSARIRELLGEDLDGFEDDGEREEDVIDGADDLLAEREETPSPEGSSSPPAETEHTESKDGPGEAGQPQSQPKEGDPARREKQEWVKKMRLQFCVRKDFEVTKTIIHRDGTLNQEYFRPPRGTKLMGEEVKKWTESDRALLVKGIEKYGIGHFREISEALLPAWQPNDLRVKSMRLMGRQNLQEYRGWRGTEEDIKAEFARNNEIGVRLGCWKSGVLVFDDDGLVDAEVKANPVKVPIVEAEDEVSLCDA
ncbi:uncharacterized protein EV422DRAFT_496437 [Fimicolochytrium jonesii]|uniref:uncharacterized protein n=1 Tax=Fimicolochytrium jonesii TaxID=1396493 RepID=UPI0022FE1C82|nr:uncharacterized protein EV422DRAFT_496437 [Fimicolochytrium jonesii]KAI8820736.1 hypothetical protein EV422DRAFT_496437 [Fimicolochytrium jonesii]